MDAGTGTITTIAGTGSPGAGCNNCPATQSSLGLPSGLAFYGTNNLLYVVENGNNRVRAISLTSGNIVTVAGSGAIGFAGDGGPAVNAKLTGPMGVAVDNAGNVFIADTGNDVIREVTGGNISTVAGQGNVAGYTGDGGPATSATMYPPGGVAVDASGSLYITNSINDTTFSKFVNVIRKVTGDASHTISTIAGNASAGYSGDGGPAQSALLNGPSAIAIDGQNNLYFVDANNHAVRRILSTAAPLTLPLTAAGAMTTSAFPLTLSNTSNQSLIVSYSFPANFTAGPNGTCPAGGLTLSPGQSCTLPVNFSPTSGGSTSGNLAISSSAGTTNVFLSESNGLYFVPVTPCRVIDTRASSDPNFGAGPFNAKTSRNYAIRNTTLPQGCASGFIPATADVQAYSLNVTVMPHGPLIYLTVYPSGINPPTVSNLNSDDGRTKANAVIVPAETADANRSISIYASNPTDVIVDINGYYVPEANAGSLAYYPLAPCRAVDTRAGSGLLGQGSFIQGGNQQGVSYALTNVCSLPATAQAYALNYTALPRNGTLTYLTTWPTGTARPVASTLNSPTGVVTANAAIVPTGANGSISVYSTEDTDLIIDVAGYYAPPPANNPNAGGLALYNVTPCRAFDSRNPGASPLTGGVVASQNIANGGSCSVPATAQSYVLNTTVLPGGPLSYLTAWATGSAEPVQSVLNATDGAVTSNLAVVPTLNGSVSTYASNNTGLILDLFAYFAP